MKGFLGKVWAGVKKTGGWVAQHGPVFSSAILGLSFAVPALKPVASAAAVLIGGGQPDQDLAKDVGELAVGLVAILGVIRKLYARVKPA